MGLLPHSPHLGHLTGTQHMPQGLGAEEEHGCVGCLLTQLPHHLHQHLGKGAQMVSPWLPGFPATPCQDVPFSDSMPTH